MYLTFFIWFIPLVDIIGIKLAPSDHESNYKKSGAIPCGCNTKWTKNSMKSGIWIEPYNKLNKEETQILNSLIHLVLHPHGIAPTFLKLDSWLPGAGFYSYYIHQGNKSDKERKIVRKNRVLCILKDKCIFLKMGAIPCRCNSTSTVYVVIYKKSLIPTLNTCY